MQFQYLHCNRRRSAADPDIAASLATTFEVTGLSAADKESTVVYYELVVQSGCNSNCDLQLAVSSQL